MQPRERRREGRKVEGANETRGAHTVLFVRALGPLKWMSPEAIKDKVYSIKSDVWSFGVVGKKSCVSVQHFARSFC